jgi:16S rRNA (guanine966-N2)-methyltransferase
MIRIISGIYKGRRLKKVPSPAVRPMQDRVKGTLFNIVGARLRGATCLDGFAGTGSIGLEALSRGAATAVFVEEFHAAVKVIRDNVARCGAEEKALVLHREFNRAVIELAKKGARFDWIFLDPPYRLLAERNPLKVIRKREVLKPGGTIVLRHHAKTRPKTGDFAKIREVDLGDDILVFYTEHAASGPAPPAEIRPNRPARAAPKPGRPSDGGRSGKK